MVAIWITQSVFMWLLGSAEVFGSAENRTALSDLFHAGSNFRRISFRSEALTLFELVNFFATSGSRTTAFVPCAERRAYFPRSPREKSYSSRTPFCVGLLDFFIKLTLSPAGWPRADDANIIGSLSVNDNEQFPIKRPAHRDVTPFRQRMPWIGDRERQGIAKNSGSFIEADTVLSEIGPRFT